MSYNMDNWLLFTTLLEEEKQALKQVLLVFGVALQRDNTDVDALIQQFWKTLNYVVTKSMHLGHITAQIPEFQEYLKVYYEQCKEEAESEQIEHIHECVGESKEEQNLQKMADEAAKKLLGGLF